MSSFSDPIVWPTAPSSSASSSGARATTTKRTTAKKSRESDTILMVEESLLSEDWTAALTANFLAMDEPMTSSSASSSSSTVTPSSGGRPAQGNTTTDRRLRFKSLITPFAGLFQWLKVPPNANHTDWIYNQHLPHLYNMHAILGNCEEFCRLALESTDDVSFPSLDKWIERLLDRLRQYSFRPKDGEKPRVVLILSDIEKQVTKLQKKIAKDPQQAAKVVAEIVDGACTHVLLMYDVEIFRCKGTANIAEYLHTMTRALESQLERPLTAFNCVSKATKLKVGDELTGQQKENFMMNQTWMAMLQMIPHMSKDRALAAASNPLFSSLKRVYDAMNDQTKTKKERKLLMESAFGGKRDRDGNVRGKNPKLSKLVYRLMTEHDPEKSIGYESEEEANEPKASNNGTTGPNNEKPKTNGRKRTKKTVPEPLVSVVEVISDTLETQIGVHDAETLNFLTYDDSCPFYEDGEDSNAFPAAGDW